MEITNEKIFIACEIIVNILNFLNTSQEILVSKVKI